MVYRKQKKVAPYGTTFYNSAFRIQIPFSVFRFQYSEVRFPYSVFSFLITVMFRFERTFF